MKRLLIDTHEAWHCAAIMSQRTDKPSSVSDLYIALIKQPEQSGAVINAVVTRLMSHDHAAIVRWETASGLQEGYWPNAKQARCGQLYRLQIKQEAHNDKLCMVSADIALAGRFLIHLPHGKGATLSRHNKMVMPDYLVNQTGGWVVRRAAAATTPVQIHHEAMALQKLAQQETVPALTLWQRAIIEHGSALQTILVADADMFQSIKSWLHDFAPDLLPCLAHASHGLDFDALFAELKQTTIPFPHGGSLTIESTRALWAVDVDGGNAANHLAINIMAAKALARQMRLRNIGGVVVVDFITLDNHTERQALLNALRRATADDPAGIHVFGMSKLGLVELTRTKRGQALNFKTEA